MLRLDDLGKDIGSLCFRACLSISPVHPKGGGPGGARVLVESISGMDRHYNSKGQAHNSSSNILSLYSICPINEHYKGYL